MAISLSNDLTLNFYAILQKKEASSQCKSFNLFHFFLFIQLFVLSSRLLQKPSGPFMIEIYNYFTYQM